MSLSEKCPEIQAVLDSESEGCIVCGDCLEVMKEMPDGCVDAVVTDPPYFLPVQHYVGTRQGGYSKRSLADTSVLRAYFAQTFAAFGRIAKGDATLYVFCDAQSYPIFYVTLFPHCKHVRLLIWDKMISYNGYTWRHQHELIAWGERDSAIRVPTGDGDILRCRGVLQADRSHPAEKPVAIVETLIAKHDAPIILDPFCGSGTTCVAAKKLGRRWIGIEIDEKYCRIARNRVRNTERPLFKETGVQLSEAASD